MPKISLSNEEIKILISWLKSRRTRIRNSSWFVTIPELEKIDRRIKFLENLK
jgi:hypothetical protein